LQTDQGVFSNIKNYLTTRLQKGIVTREMQEYLHKTRLYYHEVIGATNERQQIRDVHRSRKIHLKGELMGFTKCMFNLLPPGFSVEFKFTKANDRFYIIKSEQDDEEYKVEIVGALLHLARVQLSEQAKEEFMARWKRERFYYIPYKRTDVSHHHYRHHYYRWSTPILSALSPSEQSAGAREPHYARRQVAHDRQPQHRAGAALPHSALHESCDGARR